VGHFKAHGLDVELVYTRGGNAAMQALIGGAVDYAGTSLDVAIQAYANASPPPAVCRCSRW
jgi:NitT/TauT family transport system substrate-binding protein